MIFEDRKFADIGNTVHHQYKNGIYNISDWADTVTIHMVAGEGTIHGIFKDNPKNKSSFLLAKMSSKGNLMGPNYTKRVFEIGKKNPEFVSGFIGHDKTVEGFFHNTFPIIGVMWHPERTKVSNDDVILTKIFTNKVFWKE